MQNPEFKAKQYKKHGVFAIQLSEANCNDIELLKTKTTWLDHDEPFVYGAPWADTVGHSHLVLRAGDALVYQQASGELYTMERLALERNFEMIRTDGPQKMSLKQQWH